MFGIWSVFSERQSRPDHLTTLVFPYVCIALPNHAVRVTILLQLFPDCPPCSPDDPHSFSGAMREPSVITFHFLEFLPLREEGICFNCAIQCETTFTKTLYLTCAYHINTFASYYTAQVLGVSAKLSEF
jgi:hypothetical protein